MTTSNGTDVRLREKKAAPTKQNGTSELDGLKSLSAASTPATEDVTSAETTSQATAFEQAFFFGLTMDEALHSSENLVELLYNACKYNHLELVKRCVEEKKVNINEPFNSDYPLCIARYVSLLYLTELAVAARSSFSRPCDHE